MSPERLEDAISTPKESYGTVTGLPLATWTKKSDVQGERWKKLIHEEKQGWEKIWTQKERPRVRNGDSFLVSDNIIVFGSCSYD